MRKDINPNEALLEQFKEELPTLPGLDSSGDVRPENMYIGPDMMFEQDPAFGRLPDIPDMRVPGPDTPPYIAGPDFDNGPRAIEPWYTITDDGKVTRYPLDLGSIDIDEYMCGTNDWGFSHPGEDRPSYDEWKKSVDPDYDSDSNSIELPEEILEALQKSADEAGLEPPYSIELRREDNPELFDKLEELFGKEPLYETPGLGPEKESAFFDALGKNLDGIDLDAVFADAGGPQMADDESLIDMIVEDEPTPLEAVDSEPTFCTEGDIFGYEPEPPVPDDPEPELFD